LLSFCSVIKYLKVAKRKHELIFKKKSFTRFSSIKPHFRRQARLVRWRSCFPSSKQRLSYIQR